MEKKLSLQIKSLPVNDLVVIDKSNPIHTQFLDFIHSRSKIVIFSSHLDDAVLSMGSFISYVVHKGIFVEVISVFTEGSGVLSRSIQILFENAGFHDAKSYFQERRTEDIRALKKLGNVSIKHLNYIDSAWRTSEAGEPLYPESKMGTILPQDYPLSKKLAAEFKKLIFTQKDVAIFAPLARGRHIDHQITRNALKEAFPQVIFYEDFPYSEYYENENDFIQKNNLLAVEWKGNYEEKKKAILEYKTQYVSLFGKGIMKLPYERYFVNTINLE